MPLVISDEVVVGGPKTCCSLQVDFIVHIMLQRGFDSSRLYLLLNMWNGVAMFIRTWIGEHCL